MLLAGLEFGHDIHQPKIMRPTRFGLQIQRRIGEILEEERKRAQPPGAAAASPAVVSKQVFDRVMEPVLFSCCADKRSSSTAKQFVDRQVLDAFAKTVGQEPGACETETECLAGCFFQELEELLADGRAVNADEWEAMLVETPIGQCDDAEGLAEAFGAPPAFAAPP